MNRKMGVVLACVGIFTFSMGCQSDVNQQLESELRQLQIKNMVLENTLKDCRDRSGEERSQKLLKQITSNEKVFAQRERLRLEFVEAIKKWEKKGITSLPDMDLIRAYRRWNDQTQRSEG